VGHSEDPFIKAKVEWGLRSLVCYAAYVGADTFYRNVGNQLPTYAA